MRRRELLTAGGLAVPLRLLTRLDDALALLPTPTLASSASEISARLACARRQFDASDLAPFVADLPAHHQAPAEVRDRPAIRKIVTDLAEHPRATGVRQLATTVGDRVLTGR